MSRRYVLDPHVLAADSPSCKRRLYRHWLTSVLAGSCQLLLHPVHMWYPPLWYLEEECSWALIHCMITSQDKRPRELGLAGQSHVRWWHYCGLCCYSEVGRTRRREVGHESDAFCVYCYSRSLRIMKNSFILRIM